MCSHWILYYDEKDMNILLAKLGGNVTKATKWFKKKTFTFPMKLKLFFSSIFYECEQKKKKSIDILNVLKVVLSLREMTFLFQLIDISEKIEMFIPFSSSYFVNFLVFTRNFQFIDFFKESNLIAFKCENFFNRRISKKLILANMYQWVLN